MKKNAPLSLQAIKRAATITSGMELDEAFAVEDREASAISVSEEAKEGPRLFSLVPVNFSQCALGGELSVKTIDGSEEMDLPAGTDHSDLPDGSAKENYRCLTRSPQSHG